jgi:RHS repeat-associated protein
MTKRSATGNGTLLNYYSYNPETLRLTNSLVAKPDKTMIQEFGYDYDAIGNMAYRSKTLPGGQQLKEEFWYGQLNRLTDIKLNGQPTGGHDYDPQGLGNITAKTANGQQIYSNAQYGEGTHGPHAITSATTTAGIFPSESDSLLAAYTSYEQLKSLTQGTLGLSIMYGHHHQRIKQEYTDQKDMILKLWAGACEYITQNGQTTTLTYLSSPDGLYGLHRILPDGSENIHYLHTDHLGSWTAVTDETGTVVDEQSYDAWGNRRNPETWSAYTSTPASPLFDRGFTGHEHLDGFQLINMNGRMYDPVVSRMLAPDNFVQTPDFSQNFNRYSYALNNPLMFTDPSGEFFLGTILTGAVEYFKAAAQSIWDFGETILVDGGLEFWHSGSGDAWAGFNQEFNNSWAKFDPTNPGTRFNNAWKIDVGSFKGNFGQIISRWTWELPQTLIGKGYGHLANNIGRVKDVGYFEGATVVNVTNLPLDGDQASGVTFGSFIYGEGISANPNEIDQRTGEISSGARLLRHEYGHYRQSQMNGWAYLPKYGIPSAAGADWTEIDAEYRSDQYFNDQYFFNRGRYSSDYTVVKSKWWEHGLIFSGGYFLGGGIVSALNLKFGR